VTYGAIAGLDPNRGLVFVLQALAGGLIAKKTARKTLPVDLNVEAEERQIQMEGIDDAVAATLATLPQAIPQMAMNGMDPREIVMQITQAHDLVNKGKSVVEALQEVFAPKQPPAPRSRRVRSTRRRALVQDPQHCQGWAAAGPRTCSCPSPGSRRAAVPTFSPTSAGCSPQPANQPPRGENPDG
jgi:hypothetical protein